MNEIKMSSWGEHIGSVYEYLTIRILSINPSRFSTIQKWFGKIKNRISDMVNGIEVHFNQFKEKAILMIDCENEEMIYIDIKIDDFLEMVKQLNK